MDDVNDEMLQEALRRSIDSTDHGCTEDNILTQLTIQTLNDAVSALAANIIQDSKNNPINVDRDNVLDGGLRGFKRARFNEWAGLNVIFSAEQGIDNGGLSREFLQLAVDKIRLSKLFEGPENAKCFALNYQALEQGLYSSYATILAYSIAHGGPVPDFLNQTTYRAISSSIQTVHADIDNIADYELQQKMIQLSTCTEEEEFATLVEQMSDLISLAGCMPLCIRLDQKQILIQGLCHFIVIGRVASAIESFKKGLKTCGVLDAIKKHPDIWNEAFCSRPSAALTASNVNLMFNIEDRAPEGSNKYAREKTVETYWRDFLEDLDDLGILDKLLSFATGLKAIPPCGLNPKPRLIFGHPEGADNQYIARFPRSNTCSLTLTIPILDTLKNLKII